MSPATRTLTVTVVGDLRTTLDVGELTQRAVDDVSSPGDPDVVVVGGAVPEPFAALQRLRSAGVGCPVVVECAEPVALAARAGLVPLLPTDVTYVEPDELAEAVRRAAARHHTRRRSRAVVDAANDQLTQLPRLPVVRSLQLLDELVAFSPIGVVVLQHDDTIALVNAAAAAIIDRDVAGLVGQPFSVVAPGLAVCLLAGRPSTEPGAPTEIHLGELVIEARTWEVVGDVPARVLLLDDVTYRRDAEVVLADAYAQERQLAEHLREVLSIKDSLISSVSHELRTPVAVARGMAETLRDSGSLLTDEQRGDFLERMVSNAKRLERLIAGLLDLDRLRRGKLAPEIGEVDVPAAVAAALEECWVEDRPVSVEVAEEARRARVDGMWLERVVVNLLTNASRYTPRGSPLELTIDRDRGALRIRMTDHGIGIPDAQKEALFEAFEQGEVGSPSGVGIGLSLVRQLAQLHGGSATIEDTPGGGATFVVHLGDPTPGA